MPPYPMLAKARPGARVQRQTWAGTQERRHTIGRHGRRGGVTPKRRALHSEVPSDGNVELERLVMLRRGMLSLSALPCLFSRRARIRGIICAAPSSAICEHDAYVCEFHRGMLSLSALPCFFSRRAHVRGMICAGPSLAICEHDMWAPSLALCEHHPWLASTEVSILATCTAPSLAILNRASLH